MLQTDKISCLSHERCKDIKLEITHFIGTVGVVPLCEYSCILFHNFCNDRKSLITSQRNQLILVSSLLLHEYLCQLLDHSFKKTKGPLALGHSDAFSSRLQHVIRDGLHGHQCKCSDMTTEKMHVYRQVSMHEKSLAFLISDIKI